MSSLRDHRLTPRSPALRNVLPLCTSLRDVASASLSMDKAVAYATSAFIIGFGIWIVVAGLSSGSPTCFACAALIPIAIGLWSACGDC